MSNSNIALLKVLRNQLPKEVAVDKVASVNQFTSATVLTYENQQVVKTIEKVLLDRVYHRVVPTLEVTLPMTVSEVLNRFCERDNLFLTEGVDYDTDDSPIVLENGTGLVALRVKENSPFYRGELYIPVKKVD